MSTVLKVYEYGALAPNVDAMHRVRDQMSLAHRYYNTLIEIERRRREAVDKAQRLDDVQALHDRIDKAEAEVEAIREDLSKARQRSRSSEPAATTEARARLKVLFAELKALRAQLKEARTAARTAPDVKAAIDAANTQASEALKAARAASNLYWGTYLVVESAAEQAAKTTKYPHLPRFKRWTGDGHLAVQLQNGMPTSEVHNPDTRVWVDPVNVSAWVKGRGIPLRERMQHTVVHFRIGSDGRAPIWAHVPIKMHRPLPAPGLIKWAHLLRRKVADREQWFVQFVVEVDHTALPPDPCGHGAAGIDVGWRLLDNGDIRVAVLQDEFGGRDELVLSRDWVSKMQHVEGLQALRSTNLDLIKLDLIPWLASKPDLHRDQDIFTPARAALWRSAGHVQRLFQEHAATMPEGLREKVDAWLKQDLHLWQWEAHERQKVIDQRKDLYRVWAAKVSRTYGRVALEKFDLRDVADRGNPEDGTTTDKRAPNRQRTLANVSFLRDCLKQAIDRRGGLFFEVPAEYTTLDCHACGGRTAGWSPAATVEHTCEHCGVTWDQDDNAAKNLLAAGLLAKAPEPAPDDAEKLAKFSAKQQRLRKNKTSTEVTASP